MMFLYQKRHIEEIQGKADQLMWHRSIHVLQVQLYDMDVFLFPFGSLDLLPDYSCMF